VRARSSWFPKHPCFPRQCPTEIVETCTRLHDVSFRCGKVDKSLMMVSLASSGGVPWRPLRCGRAMETRSGRPSRGRSGPPRHCQRSMDRCIVVLCPPKRLAVAVGRGLARSTPSARVRPGGAVSLAPGSAYGWPVCDAPSRRWAACCRGVGRLGLSESSSRTAAGLRAARHLRCQAQL
jgi:hypothetical protein